MCVWGVALVASMLGERFSLQEACRLRPLMPAGSAKHGLCNAPLLSLQTPCHPS